VSFIRCIYFYSSAGIGPNKKVIGQCVHLIKNGLNVKLIIAASQENADLTPEFFSINEKVLLSGPIGSGIFHRIRHQLMIRKAFIDIINSASQSDIIYLRYPYPIFYMLFPFLRQRRLCKIINEHNTIEYKEFKMMGFYLNMFVDLLVGKFIINRADGIVGATNEITSYEVMRSGNPKKSHITIGNGIEVNKIKLRKPPCLTDHELILLCVASFSRRHAIDRLLSGLALYRGNMTVRLYLVGDGQELPNLKKMVENLKLNNSVIFTGILSGNDLDNLFDKSHIAIGSLGLHRIDMKEGSILKVREYCARGIPFLYGCSDPDFPNDFPYIKRIHRDESPVDLEEIINFTERIYSDTDHHLKMRAYAEKNLDWSVKMKKLKDFCEVLVER